MDSTTLLACNKRFIVSAVGDLISTRRTNEALTLLKPDFLGHKGEVTHVTIHQPDHLYGTQDDWGRVVASSDVTNRVKVWLCDGEEEELMFARNMAEYVGYEKVTALGWTADSKVAIGMKFLNDLSADFKGTFLGISSFLMPDMLLLDTTELWQNQSPQSPLLTTIHTSML